MNQQQINQQAQQSFNNSQHHHKFSLLSSKVGEFLSGDYLYMVESNKAPNPRDNTKTISLNGHAKLFKKVVKTQNQHTRQGFTLKQSENLQFPVVLKKQDSLANRTEIVFEDQIYQQVLLNGSTIQEILKHANLN